MTQVTATFSDARVHESKAFRDFKLGDVLYVCDEGASNQSIGIKINETSIRFIIEPSGRPQQVAHAVPPSQRYGVPASVTITVTK